MKFTLTAPSGTNFNAITFTASGASYALPMEASTGECSADETASKMYWAADAGVNTVTFTNPNTKQIRFTELVVTLGDGAGELGGGGEVTPPEPNPDTTNVTTIAALNALEDGTAFSFAGSATVSGVSGRYLYIQDDTEGALLYGSDWTVKYGDVITAFSGKRQDYSGTKEFQSIEGLTVDGTKNLTPVDVANAEAAKAELNEYVKLSNVSLYIEENTQTITFADGSTLPAYNRFNKEFAAGTYATLYGIVGQYGETIQFYYISETPLEITDAPDAQAVATVAEILALEVDTPFTFTGELVVSYASGAYMFAQDSTGALLMYGNTWEQTYGDVIKSFSGKVTLYNGNKQATQVANLVVEGQKAIEPTVVDNAAKAAEYVNYYVQFNDVSVDGTNIVFLDGSTLATYDRFGIAITGEEYGEMFGIVGIYGDTVQFYFISDKALELGDGPTPPQPVEDDTLVVADASDLVGEKTDNGTQPLESMMINGYTFTLTPGTDISASQNPAYWANDNTLRIYKGASMKIQAPEGTTFTGIVWNCKNIKGVSDANPITSTPTGEFTYEAKAIAWETAEAVNEVTFTLPAVADADNANPNVQILSFTLVGLNTMVDELVAGSEAVSVVYDLNGRIVKSNTLEKGIYIVRQGNKSHKIMVK